ncbi:MAG: hypothetical protein GDA56_01340 [Hormoscilla sp. GM7CHS1pb]|nr:hypothetical protein [Hormoscilla sp. GM7CHS1pb]
MPAEPTVSEQLPVLRSSQIASGRSPIGLLLSWQSSMRSGPLLLYLCEM